MKALELTRQYWQTAALPSLTRQYPELLCRTAAGLVGNGSECFGFDDAQSKDHDWGVDFYLWVRQEEEELLPLLCQWKERLFAESPPPVCRTPSAYGAVITPMTVESFYYSLTGCPGVPGEALLWSRVPESHYAMAVNGAVFFDGPGAFTAVRRRLLDYYPEDLRRKRIAARCMAIAQLGQYNFQRMAVREDWVTVHTVLDRFAWEAMGLVYHLNRVYRPYYKWAWRGLEQLAVLGEEIAELLAGMLTEDPRECADRSRQQQRIDTVCRLLGEELRRQRLSNFTGDFFTGHGEAVQGTIQEERLRRLPAQFDPVPKD